MPLEGDPEDLGKREQKGPILLSVHSPPLILTKVQQQVFHPTTNPVFWKLFFNPDYKDIYEV